MRVRGGHNVRGGAPGFTLVEVLVAMAILVTGMVGVLAVFATATRSHARAVHSIEAANIAAGVVAEARARFRGTGTLPTGTAEKVPGKPRYTYDVKYVGGWDKNDEELLMIVGVTWLERGRDSTTEFTTILVKKSEQ